MVNKTLYTIRNNKSKSGVCDSSNVNKNKKRSSVKIKKKNLYTPLFEICSGTNQLCSC